MDHPTPSSLVVANPSPECLDSEGFQRIESTDALTPGHYWRATRRITNAALREIPEGEVLLLVDVFDFEGVAHSVKLLEHPRHGGRQMHQMLVADFLNAMEPAQDGQAVRDREQDRIMAEVADLQSQMARAQTNPLQLPSVQEAAESAVAEAERQMEREIEVGQQTAEQRQNDLRRIHRRAARRSEASGNPLAVRKVVVSNQLGTMLNEGVTPEGVHELAIEARRRVAIAEAAANVMTSLARGVADKMQSLTPYYAEKGQVALALAKKAIQHSKAVTQGIRSLNLYTGQGVDVVTVREGSSAPTHEPLTMVQGKRFMDEELAVHMDIDDSFDVNSQQLFFKALAENDALLDQVIPFPRAVLTMAVTRREIDYSGVNAYEAAMRAVANKSVFLLVRDGQNVHVVYSNEPSHEASPRLFPLVQELQDPFVGIDGETIGLKDVAFSSATEVFDAVALHYKRLLILLMGLDHRMRLMGEFYPPEETLSFMGLGFQAKYFRFLEDDRVDNQLGGEFPSAYAWIRKRNEALRSGSRVFLLPAMRANSPFMERRYGSRLDAVALRGSHVVSREGKHHFVSVPVLERDGDRVDTKVWLDGPHAKYGAFLCLDTVLLPELERYVHSRLARVASINWILLMRRAIGFLSQEAADQSDLRAYLRQAALEHGGSDEASVDNAVVLAINTWRASRRGAPAPGMSESKKVHEILSLMHPTESLAQSLEGLVNKAVQGNGWKPLRFVRTGKNGFAIYVQASEQDRAPYGHGVRWGWVKRVALTAGKTKLSTGSSSLVWLEKNRPNAAEEEVMAWPGLVDWVHDRPEPVRLKHLSDFMEHMAEADRFWAPILSAGRGGPNGLDALDATFVSRLFQESAEALDPIRYFEAPMLHVPVAVIETDNPNGSVRFVYAQAPVATVLRRYGSESLVHAFYKNVVGRRFSFPFNRFESLAIANGKWRLVSMDEPTKPVTLSKGRPLEASTIKVKVQSKKRQTSFRGPTKGQVLDTATAHLSFNRTVETLLGIARRAKRDFHREQRRQVADAKRWRGLDSKEEVHKKVKAIMERTYKGPALAHHLSGLLWNGRRAVASDHFSSPNPS